jgi:hypothetical protein
MTISRTLHRLGATAVGAFALMHLTNHVVGLRSAESHIAFMEAARVAYRNRWVEPLVLVSVAVQVASGLALLLRGWSGRRGAASWLQAASGAYLAFFVVAHVGAVLVGRLVLGLDTNFYFAAAGFQVFPYPLFFGPYYSLAVLALVTHLGGVVSRWVQRRSARAMPPLWAPLAVGAAIGALIVASLAGGLFPLEVPPRYRATFEAPGHGQR